MRDLKSDHIDGRVDSCAGCDWGRLGRAIRRAWSADTSAADDWSSSNPSLGQCAVTALVVQDAHGGDLIRVVNEGVSHYYNRLPNGVEIDLTRDQFQSWAPSEPEERSRDYVLSFEPTAARYEILRRRVGQL